MQTDRPLTKPVPAGRLESTGRVGGDLLHRLLAVGMVAIAALCTIPGTSVWTFEGAASAGPISLVLVAAVALSLPWLERAYRRGSSSSSSVSTRWPWSQRLEWLVMAVVFTLTSALFFQLSFESNYGDARMLVHFVGNGEWFHKRAPLSIATFQLVHGVIGDPRESIQLVSSLAGGMAVLVTVRFARSVVPGSLALQVATWLGVLTIGSVVLFFGHVEHYALPTALAMLFVYLGTRSLRDEGSPLPAVAAATLAAGVHLSMLTLMPAVAFLCWHRCVRGRRPLDALARGVTALAVVAIPAAALYFAMHEVGYLRAGEKGFGGGDRLMFVPLHELRGRSQYLFLRPDHLLAIANQQLLTAPVSLFTSLLVGGAWIVRRVRDRGTPRTAEDATWTRVLLFTALAAFAFFGLTVIWNPDKGPMGDWSLFAPAGYLLAMLAALLVVRNWRATPSRAFAVLLLITAVNLHRTLPWLWYNLVE